jgi:hypothetical protein
LENIGAKMSDQIDFANIEELLEQVNMDKDTPSNASITDPKQYDQDLYKKWFRSKTQSGFLSIKPWYQGLKFKLDIGKTSADGKLISSTMVFVDAIDFAAYLRSIANNTATVNFPANDRTGVPTAEGFVSYGGGIIDSKPISRIFKSHYWQSGETYDSSAFVWKCGHFAARKSDSGAFIPDMKSPVSVDSIKVTRQDIVTISYMLDLSLASHVTNNPDWYNI